MRLQIINRTRKPEIPVDYLKELIRFCEPRGLDNHLLVWDFAYAWHKQALKGSHITGVHQPFVEHHRVFNYNLIKIRMSKSLKYKNGTRKVGKDGYIDFPLYSPDEFLVSIIAHEYYHELQDRGITRHYKGMGDGVPPLSDRDEYQADRYALQRVREYRRFIYQPNPIIDNWRIFDA